FASPCCGVDLRRALRNRLRHDDAGARDAGRRSLPSASIRQGERLSRRVSGRLSRRRTGHRGRAARSDRQLYRRSDDAHAGMRDRRDGPLAAGKKTSTAGTRETDVTQPIDTIRPARLDDAADIAAIYNEGIRGRASTVETHERGAAE